MMIDLSSIERLLALIDGFDGESDASIGISLEDKGRFSAHASGVYCCDACRDVLRMRSTTEDYGHESIAQAVGLLAVRWSQRALEREEHLVKLRALREAL